MSPLPVVSGRDFIKKLSKIGFVQVRQRGSHIVLQRKEPFAQLSVPDHKTLDRGTLRSLIRQANLTVDEFNAL